MGRVNLPAEITTLAGVISGGESAPTRWAAVEQNGGGELFTSLRSVIYTAMRFLIQQGAEIYPNSLQAELARAGQLEAFSDFEATYDLLLTQKEFETALKQAHTAWTGRFLEQVAKRLAIAIDAPATDYDELLGKVASTIIKRNLRVTQSPLISASEVIDRDLEELRRIRAGEIRPILTPWAEVNEQAGGCFPGELTIIGGDPSSGKTSFMVHWVQWLSILNDYRSLIVELEMTDRAVSRKLRSIGASIPSWKYRRPECLNVSDLQRDSEYAERQRKAHYAFVREPWNLTVEKVAEIVDYADCQGRKPEVLLVDYLTLLESKDTRQPKAERVNAVARGLKEIARCKEIVVICYAGTNRETGKANYRAADSHLPTMFDVEYGGEKHADAVWILSYDRSQMDRDERLLAICKNRFGKRDIGIHFDFDTEYQSFSVSSRHHPAVIDLEEERERRQRVAVAEKEEKREERKTRTKYGRSI